MSRWADESFEDYERQVQRAIDFAGLPHDHFIAGKARWLEGFARGRAGRVEALLDVGCGIGLLHRHLGPVAERVVGVDVSAAALAQARAKNPGVRYVRHGGTQLPFDDATFDLALAVTVLHHVPPTRWLAFVLEAHRVLRPGGALVVFEHNPWNPATRYSVARSALDHDAVLLRPATATSLLGAAGFAAVRCEYLFFVPLRARLIQRLEQRLHHLPLGAQYAAYGDKR